MLAKDLGECFAKLGGPSGQEVEFIETHYGYRDFLDDICRSIDSKLIYDRVKTEQQNDLCKTGNSAFMYPSNCGEKLKGCISHCNFTNFDRFYCTESPTSNCTLEPGQLVIFNDVTKPSFVGDFDTADECVNESLQSQIFKGINYGYGYASNDSTNCHAFANNALLPLAIKKTGSSAQSCLFRDENVKKEGAICGSGDDGTDYFFCGECDDQFQCCNEYNKTNLFFGCGTCQTTC